MVSVYDLKPKFQKLLRPLLKFLIRINITPNIVTILALLMSALSGLTIYLFKDNYKILIILPFWLFLRMALNAIDGMMAREFNLKSNLGAILNEVGDILSDIFIYFPLMFMDKSTTLSLVSFLFLAIITEFIGVLMQALGTDRQYQGPMGKSDRAFAIGGLALFTAFFPSIMVYWNIFFWILGLLATVTCINRGVQGLKELNKNNQERLD